MFACMTFFFVLLPFYSITLLLFYSFTLLLWYSYTFVIFILVVCYCCNWVIFYYCTFIQLYSCYFTLVLFYSCALLFLCSLFLPYVCSPVLLYSWTLHAFLYICINLHLLPSFPWMSLSRKQCITNNIYILLDCRNGYLFYSFISKARGVWIKILTYFEVWKSICTIKCPRQWTEPRNWPSENSQYILFWKHVNYMRWAESD